MKCLINNALSEIVSRGLAEAGYDAVHVRTRGLARAKDTDLIALARTEGRIIVSADSDFGTILALRHEREPSFILFRGDCDGHPNKQLDELLRVLPVVENYLHSGAIVVISDKVRVRELPIE